MTLFGGEAVTESVTESVTVKASASLVALALLT
jgi:hypothetical protein